MVFFFSHFIVCLEWICAHVKVVPEMWKFFTNFIGTWRPWINNLYTLTGVDGDAQTPIPSLCTFLHLDEKKIVDRKYPINKSTNSYSKSFCSLNFQFSPLFGAEKSASSEFIGLPTESEGGWKCKQLSVKTYFLKNLFYWSYFRWYGFAENSVYWNFARNTSDYFPHGWNCCCEKHNKFFRN